MLGITWKEESATAPSGVLDPGGVDEVVTSEKKTEFKTGGNRQNLEPTWSRVGDPDHGGVTLFLQRVLWLRGSLGADNYPGPVSIRVNCIRLLVNWHHQCQR